MLVLQSSQVTPIVVSCRASRIDAINGLALQSRLLALADQGQTRLVVDFTGVTSITASGVVALLAVFKRVGGAEGLVLSCVSAAIYDVLKLTGMERIFAIQPNNDGAIRHLRVLEQAEAA